MLFVCFVFVFLVENGSIGEDGVFYVDVLWMYFNGSYFKSVGKGFLKDFFFFIFGIIIDNDEERVMVFE